MSDPEEASVFVVANRIDIKYAEIARKKSRNPDVLNFAETMAKDHNTLIAGIGPSEILKVMTITIILIMTLQKQN